MEQLLSTHVADAWSLAMSEVHSYIHVEGRLVQECGQVLGRFCPGCVIQTVMEAKGSDVGLKPSEWPLAAALSAYRAHPRTESPCFSCPCPLHSFA